MYITVKAPTYQPIPALVRSLSYIAKVPAKLTDAVPFVGTGGGFAVDN